MSQDKRQSGFSLSFELRKMRDIELQVMVLRKLLSEKEGELLDVQQAVVGDALGRVDVEALEVGHWKCNGSPVGHCVYDPEKDLRMDCCLFCKQPRERK